LEKLGGDTLQKHFSKDGKYPKRRVYEIGMAIADALDYLHEGFHPKAKIIHRDMKPDNIGFMDDGTVKILDFGLSTCVKKSATVHDCYEMSGKCNSDGMLIHSFWPEPNIP
jgi:serine/threonine protein kinase